MLRRVLFLIACLALPLALPQVARAASPQEMIDRARLALQSVRDDHTYQPSMDNLLGKAAAVLIVPSMFRGGFIIGGEGGTGVMLVRNRDGSWSNPAFYDCASGSIGLQIGAQTAEVVFVIMNERAVKKFLDNQFKVGADLSIAIGPLGGGADAALAGDFKSDIYSYSKAQGLFGGMSLEGTVISIKESWNRNYYGPGATAREILYGTQFNAQGAGELQRALPPPTR